MESSIFLNDLTVIDYSIITPQGVIVGGAATLNLEITGPVESHEGVVIDFSACKKQIKALIDGKDGFDHKCWVNVDDHNVVMDLSEEYHQVTHRVSGLNIRAEREAFAYVSNDPTVDIAEFLNVHMAPYVVSNVCLNTNIIPVPRANTSSPVFRYVHGLKNSSSYGCKNIVHGHKSWISAVVNEDNKSFADQILRGIATDLDGCIFVHAEDLQSTEDGVYKIGYDTDERGKMSMSFTQKLIVLETQTTVEHIVEYIRARYYDQLKYVGVKELFVSEGLCKGAKVTL